MAFEGSARFLILSDDGALEIEVSDKSECVQGELLKNGKCRNKHLADEKRKSFRAMWLEPELQAGNQKD